MKIEFVDLKAQYRSIEDDVQKRMNAVLEHGKYIMGPEVQELEDELTTYTGSKHCISVASGTEALLMALMVLDIKPGDEVITTPFTFISTVECIVRVGATPIFVDIEPDTCNIDASLIEAAITDRTKAIIPVSLYGQTADMDAINELAKKHGNIPVIEDAAQSFGALYKGTKSCNLSSISCTSFFPSKPLGCYGDGGAIFTNDDDIAKACREVRVHGQSARYVHTSIGVGGRMDTIQCAVVLAKLAKFDWEVNQRLEIGARYNEMLDAENIARVQQVDGRTSVFAQYTILSENRDALKAKLGEVGIPTAVHYPIPLNEQPAYKELSIGHTPIASEVAGKVMSLPMSAYLKEEEQDFVVETLRHCI